MKKNIRNRLFILLILYSAIGTYAKTVVIVHSMNIEGATILEKQLKNIAKNLKRIPFKFITSNTIDVNEVIIDLIL